MASYAEEDVVILKHLKTLAERTQDEIATLAGIVAGAIEEAVADKAYGNLRIFYGTCETAASTQTKVVTIDGLSALMPGDIFGVLMSSGQSYNGTPKLKVNTFESVNIRRVNGKNAAQYEWAAGQMVIFTYTGSYFLIAGGGVATTTYYGKTKLSSAVDSTSEVLAATPKAVKLAYDMASGKTARFTAQVSIPTTGWVLSDGLYHISVSVTGLLATDMGGGVGPVQTGTVADDKAILKAWSKVTRLQAAAGTLIVYASAVPSVAIPILIEVFR